MSKINLEVTGLSDDPTVRVRVEGGFTLYSMFACYSSLMTAFSRACGLSEEVLERLFSIIKEGTTSMTLDLGELNKESDGEI